MARNKETLGTAIANALASAHGKGVKTTDTDLGNSIADAVDDYVGDLELDLKATDIVPVPTSTAGGLTGASLFSGKLK